MTTRPETLSVGVFLVPQLAYTISGIEHCLVGKLSKRQTDEIISKEFRPTTWRRFIRVPDYDRCNWSFDLLAYGYEPGGNEDGE